MLIWIAAILVAGAVLAVGIERLLARLDIHPSDPEERPGGFRDVIKALADRTRKSRE